MNSTEMPRVRVRTTSRGQAPSHVYVRACVDVERGISIRKAAEMHGLNHVTLSRFVKRRAEAGTGTARLPGYWNPHNRVFTPEQEDKLQQYLKTAAAIYFGLSPKEVSAF